MLILGLGNPGPEYESTNHNCGFDAVAKTAAFYQLKLRKRCFCLYRHAEHAGHTLVQPLTFMNRSGEIRRYFPDVDAENMIVICDQMDLPPGMIRIRKGGGSAGHNGLKSIIAEFGSSDFIRIYVGIGRPPEGVSVPDHVLSKRNSPLVEEGISKASQALIQLLEGKSLGEVELAFNRRNV